MAMSFSFIRKVLRRTELFSANNRNNLLKHDIDHGKLLSTKVDVPSPPKKPLTAYMIFCKENRQALLRENPFLKSTQQIKLLAAKWTDLSPEMKKPYEDSAREKTILYGEMHKNFYEKLTDEQRLELSRIKQEKRESRKLRKLKQDLRDTNMPQRPHSAYVIFIQSNAAKKSDLTVPPKTLQDYGVMWRNLTEEQKKPYYEQATLQKEQYESKMKDWNANLIEEGKSDLLGTYKATKEKLKQLSLDENKVPQTKKGKENILKSKKE